MPEHVNPLHRATVRVTITTENGEVLENFAVTRLYPQLTLTPLSVRLAHAIRNTIDLRWDTDERHVRGM
jgi:hypothetical protein